MGSTPVGGSVTRKSKKSNWVARASAIFLLVLMASFIYFEYVQASKINDYISDECWYVSAARNILRVIFGVTPQGRHGGYIEVTVQLDHPATRMQYSEWITEVRSYVLKLGGRVVKDDSYYAYKEGGDFLPAVCVDVPESEINYLGEVPHMVKYAIGYCYPNARDILDYMNYEHPPLVKYLICLTMEMNDSPIMWRIPSIIAGSLILVLIFMALREVLGKEVGGALGVVAAILTALDHTFRALSMVAMLDIFVALFTYLTYYAVIRRSTFFSSLALGFGFSSKFSGGFPGIAALVELIKRKEAPGKVILYLVYIPLAVFLILSLPEILKNGWCGWWNASIAGALKWHLSQKTTGGPPQAMPWDWLLGRNSFVLHYAYDSSKGKWIPDVVASGSPILYLLTLALSIFILPHVLRMPDKGSAYSFTWLTYLMYYLIYFLGTKTQYSFYFVQIIPLLYTLLIMELYYLLKDTNHIKEIIFKWREWFRAFIDWLGGRALIIVHVKVIYKK
jgi:predicted membrane-bound dolichyl-phosphate-mannose-protein mannosyltransferase